MRTASPTAVRKRDAVVVHGVTEGCELQPCPALSKKESTVGAEDQNENKQEKVSPSRLVWGSKDRCGRYLPPLQTISEEFHQNLDAVAFQGPSQNGGAADPRHRHASDLSGHERGRR
ncbi:hypothetical protein NDU88_000533 [Pleurodeles waltl]|uniref:Uncharacterized protein n=1 Tax=Pleurodeles waltl TaxID=8319 RepID=A0AAV7U5R9_PLEWA|nr:hypothetical protein NDU88_000533 [Pleurodeles waltl]